MRERALAIAFAVNLVAAAAGAADYAEPGPYFALNGVAAFPEGAYDNAVGGSLRFGYRWASGFGLEAQAEYAGRMESEGTGPRVYLLPVTLNARCAFGASRVQPYGLIGVGAGGSYRSTGGTDVAALVRVGGGAEIYLTEGFGLLLEATYNAATERRVRDYTSLGWGLFVRF